MIKERRKHPRVKTSIIPSELFTIRINDILKKIGDIKNLSEGGCGIKSDNMFKVGDEIFVSFELPGKMKYVDGLGKVVRTGGNLLGIKFIKIDFSDEANIKMFVKREMKEDPSKYIADLHKVCK